MRQLLVTLSLLLGTLSAGAVRQEEAPVPRISAFVAPLYLEDLPPPVRTTLNIHLVHKDVPEVQRGVTRTREETVELANHIVALLRSGESFQRLAIEYSAARNAAQGAVLGSFPPGLLAPAMDEFLFGAEVGGVSEPVETGNGIHILKRVETYAATRHIHVRGRTEESKALVEELLSRVLAGEDFGAVAKEASEDKRSASLGGLFTIFERGSSDRLLKEAAFQAAIGEVKGPVESPAGYHLIQRVPLEGHPPELRELTMVRIRAILISHDNTQLGGITAERSLQEAERLAREIHSRIQAGEDMGNLARTYNDDIGGRTRAGDIGWVHRGNPRSAPFLARAFQAQPGELLEPVLTNLGWVVVRREI